MNSIGPHCPIDLPQRNQFAAPYIVRLSRSFDAEGFEQGERINGFMQCPKCGLWWPCIEQPDCWEEEGDGCSDENIPGRWKAVGWWGGTVCEECDLLMVEQPDGTAEAFSLRQPA